MGHPSNANTTFTMGTDAAELTASFLSVPSHKLVLEANPSAGGTFKVNGVAYNPAEDYYVAQGATVTVEAINQTGYVFHHWVADGASVSSTLTAVTTFVVGNSNVTLTAHFDPTLTLTVDPANTGTLKVNDENYTRPVSIPSGTEVTVTAIPEAGYRFVNWTNGETVVSTDASYTFTSTGVPVSLTAHFAQSGRRTNHNRR